LKMKLMGIMLIASWALSRLKHQARERKTMALEKSASANAVKHINTATLPAPDGHSPNDISTAPEAANIDMVHYDASNHSHQGRLIIGTDAVRLETIIRGKVIWRIAYERLRRIEKVCLYRPGPN